MSEIIHFEVEDDVVMKYTPMPEIGENTYKTEVVMTKEIFQECYKRWVEQQEVGKVRGNMEKYVITAEINLKKIITESREVAQALNEFADNLERIEKKVCRSTGK